MSTAPVLQRLTADEFVVWCQAEEREDNRYELDAGVPRLMSPTPAPRHGLVCLNVGALLRAYAFARKRGWVAGADSGLLLERSPDTVLGPDAAYFDDNLKYSEVESRYTTRKPVLVVEVLSPSDRPNRTIRKLLRYLKSGVKQAWLVDPEGEDLTIYEASGATTALTRDDVIDGGAILPGFVCPVRDLFRTPADDP